MKKQNSYRSFIKFAAEEKKRSFEYQHCPVCSKESHVIGTNGFSKQYVCGTCKFKFSNK